MSVNLPWSSSTVLLIEMHKYKLAIVFIEALGHAVADGSILYMNRNTMKGHKLWIGYYTYSRPYAVYRNLCLQWLCTFLMFLKQRRAWNLCNNWYLELSLVIKVWSCDLTWCTCLRHPYKSLMMYVWLYTLHNNNVIVALHKCMLNFHCSWPLRYMTVLLE